MEYLKNFVKEAQRVDSVFGTNFPLKVKNTFTEEGIEFKKGTFIRINLHGLHYNKN